MEQQQDNRREAFSFTVKNNDKELQHKVNLLSCFITVCGHNDDITIHQKANDQNNIKVEINYSLDHVQTVQAATGTYNTVPTLNTFLAFYQQKGDILPFFTKKTADTYRKKINTRLKNNLSIGTGLAILDIPLIYYFPYTALTLIPSSYFISKLLTKGISDVGTSEELIARHTSLTKQITALFNSTKNITYIADKSKSRLEQKKHDPSGISIAYIQGASYIFIPQGALSSKAISNTPSLKKVQTAFSALQNTIECVKEQQDEQEKQKSWVFVK